MKSEAGYNLLITGLRNAHAMESQAREILERQIERTNDYPNVKAKLKEHLKETNEQSRRLEECLDKCGESPSVVKDAALATMGNFAALSHSIASDEIIKNTLANNMFENFEIGTYKTLIVMANNAGIEIKQLLTRSLREEEQMAAWVSDNIEKITLEFLAIQDRKAV
jgi:ferritin-like metal-binding protein YciE